MQIVTDRGKDLAPSKWKAHIHFVPLRITSMGLPIPSA
jgi:hypothetical protein